MKLRQLLTIPIILAFFSTSLIAQQSSAVSGKITAADQGEALVGAKISIKGTATTVLSDIEGNYEIRIPSSSDIFYSRNDVPDPILVFEYTGFETFEAEVSGTSKLNVKLQLVTKSTDELISTGTAVGKAPELVPFSAGVINEEGHMTVPAPILGAGFQGKIPGLRTYQAGGQPGQEVYFQLRSANAIANGQQPLVLVDGIYLNGSTLADLNPDDIERVEVLKGPAGAALYGSQGANGVIQVFTKRGKDLEIGESRVIYRGEFGYTEEAGRYGINEYTNREVLNSAGPQPILGAPTIDQIHNVKLPNLQNYQDQYLFDRGGINSNYIAVQGKTHATNFMASYQRFSDNGVIQNNDGYIRNATRLNLDHKISNKFDIQLSTQYSNSRQDLLSPYSNGPESFIATTLLMTPIFDLDASNEENDSEFDWDIDNTGNNITNPLYDQRNSEQTVKRTRLLGNIVANYRPKRWLTFSYSAALDRSSNNYEHYINKGYLSTNMQGMFGPLVSASIANSDGGGIHRSNRINTYYTSTISGAIDRSFGNFNTGLRAGFLYENQMQEYNEGIGENLAVDGIRSLDNARSNVLMASEEQKLVAYNSFFVADIDYKEKLLFSGLFRAESSSLFGEKERSTNYYRVSGGYRLTKDVKIKFFQEILLRASIGTAGIRPHFEQRFETYELVNGTITKNTLGNDFLRPAHATEMEAGINTTFLKAFDLEFNYSTITTKDQILFVPLTGAAGFEGQWRNAGTVEAENFEAALNIDFKTLFKIKTKDFRWDLRASADKITQTVTQLDIPSYTTGPGYENSSIFLIEEGAPLGAMVGEVYATSVEQLAEQGDIDVRDYAINDMGYVVRQDEIGTPLERPYKLVDEQGNPLVQQIGDMNPEFRMGIAHTLGFKGLKIYTLFDWKKGGDIYNLSRQTMYGDERHVDLSQYDNIAGGFYAEDGLYNQGIANNHFVEDGSYFMLREASLSYLFDKKSLKGLFKGAMEGIQLSLIGRNLFTKTEYTGFHPDVTSAPRGENSLTNRVDGGAGSDAQTPFGDPAVFAVDAFNYPLRKSYTFSIQVIF